MKCDDFTYIVAFFIMKGIIEFIHIELIQAEKNFHSHH